MCEQSLTLVAEKGKIRHIRCSGGVRPFEKNQAGLAMWTYHTMLRVSLDCCQQYVELLMN